MSNQSSPSGTGSADIDAAIPANVQASHAFLTRHNMEFIPSRNPPATSCKDAARGREKLGCTGIPLCYELKSRVYFNQDTNRYFMIHIRGCDLLDLDKVNSIFPNLTEVENEDIYGLVNPFCDNFLGKPVDHFWDHRLSDRPFENNMHTNAGDRTYGVEFSPNAHPDFKDGHLFDFTPDDCVPWPKRTTLGIITGNPPESGTLYYDLVRKHLAHLITGANENISTSNARASLVQMLDPETITLSNTALNVSMNLQKVPEQTKQIVSTLVKKICAHGLDFLALPCNTIASLSDAISNICSNHAVSFLDMRTAIDTALNEYPKTSRVLLLALGFIADSTRGSYADCIKDFQHLELSEKDAKLLADLAWEVKMERSQAKLRQKLNQIITNILKGHSAADTTERGSNPHTQNLVVVALTELSLLFKEPSKFQFPTGVIVIDTVDTYARMTAEALFIRSFCPDNPDATLAQAQDNLDRLYSGPKLDTPNTILLPALLTGTGHPPAPNHH